MKVKVKDSQLPNAWYADMIGCEFDHVPGKETGSGEIYVNAFFESEGWQTLPIRHGDYELVMNEQEIKTINNRGKLIYVAAPYRSNDPFERELNVKAAQYAGYKLAMMGFYPVMPTVNTQGFDAIGDDSFWLESTLELMRRCDAVYVVDGSHNSEGVRGEVTEAEKIGLPVYVLMEGLINE